MDEVQSDMGHFALNCEICGREMPEDDAGQRTAECCACEACSKKVAEGHREVQAVVENQGHAAIPTVRPLRNPVTSS